MAPEAGDGEGGADPGPGWGWGLLLRTIASARLWALPRWVLPQSEHGADQCLPAASSGALHAKAPHYQTYNR